MTALLISRRALNRALIDYVRARARAGARSSEIGPGVRAQAERAFALLERGLGDYARGAADRGADRAAG